VTLGLVAALPLIVTWFAAEVGSKLLPLIVISAKGPPEVGEKLAMVGAPTAKKGVFRPLKRPPNWARSPATGSSFTCPEVAPEGTFTTSWVALPLTMGVDTPLKV